MKTLTKVLLILFISISQISIGQIQTDSLKIDQNFRSFHYLSPAKKQAKLVFILHGSGGTGMQIREYAGKPTQKIEEIAPKENILLVFPNGYKKFWNECRKTADSEANHLNINEEAFFSEMISYFHQKYEIDRQSVYVIGTSGGGHMAYKLAMTMPEKIRAITAIVASLPDETNFDCVAKGVAKPIMIVNGTADPLNKYEGGEIILGGNRSLGLVRSTDATFDYWSKLAGYTGKPTMQILPDNDPKDGKIVEKYTFKDTNKPEVSLYKVIGGKHDYPNDIDVYIEALEFFKRN